MTLYLDGTEERKVGKAFLIQLAELQAVLQQGTMEAACRVKSPGKKTQNKHILGKRIKFSYNVDKLIFIIGFQ